MHGSSIVVFTSSHTIQKNQPAAVFQSEPRDRHSSDLAQVLSGGARDHQAGHGGSHSAVSTLGALVELAGDTAQCCCQLQQLQHCRKLQSELTRALAAAASAICITVVFCSAAIGCEGNSIGARDGHCANVQIHDLLLLLTLFLDTYSKYANPKKIQFSP